MHAKKVFRRKGFEPTTMTDIKEEAIISFGGLYSYFSSTEEIFLQLLELEYKLNDDHMTMCQSDSVWDHVKHFLENQKSELRAIRDSLIPVSYEYFVSA